jgi:hypothetical protein
LQININGGTGADGFGEPDMGSRVFQWNWNPVGGSKLFDNPLTPDDLKGYGQVGSVTISIT